MIAKLHGMVDTIGEDYFIIDVNGVGYLVYASALEKEWFITLTKVQGVGAKVCLSILSALTPLQLAQAISAQDKASFTRANGVGPKLAARIVTELKDKIVTIPVAATTSAADIEKELNMDVDQEVNAYEDSLVAMESNSANSEDAISALVNLGYQRMEAYRAVNKVQSENPNADVSELIRLSLKEFAKKD